MFQFFQLLKDFNHVFIQFAHREAGVGDLVDCGGWLPPPLFAMSETAPRIAASLSETLALLGRSCDSERCGFAPLGAIEPISNDKLVAPTGMMSARIFKYFCRNDIGSSLSNRRCDTPKTEDLN